MAAAWCARILMIAGICCLTATAQVPQRSTPFQVMWNSQWPEQCEETFPADSITRFGIKTNANNSFNGDVWSTLYSIGNWPMLWPNGSIHSNGGIPQRGSLELHLSAVRDDVEKLFPDPAFDGYVA